MSLMKQWKLDLFFYCRIECSMLADAPIKLRITIMENHNKILCYNRNKGRMILELYLTSSNTTIHLISVLFDKYSISLSKY